MDSRKEESRMSTTDEKIDKLTDSVTLMSKYMTQSAQSASQSSALSDEQSVTKEMASRLVVGIGTKENPELNATIKAFLINIVGQGALAGFTPLEELVKSHPAILNILEDLCKRPEGPITCLSEDQINALGDESLKAVVKAHRVLVYEMLIMAWCQLEVRNGSLVGIESNVSAHDHLLNIYRKMSAIPCIRSLAQQHIAVKREQKALHIGNGGAHANKICKICNYMGHIARDCPHSKAEQQFVPQTFVPQQQFFPQQQFMPPMQHPNVRQQGRGGGPGGRGGRPFGPQQGHNQGQQQKTRKRQHP